MELLSGGRQMNRVNDLSPLELANKNPPSHKRILRRPK
jgi:hypothetical protein